MANMNPSPFPEALGVSEAFLRLGERISRAARVNRPVLLMGERGTGKELAARKLHYLSPRWQGPLVALNCAALAPGLIESELFGHEAGAFTGASRQRPGRFEAANEGTLFLDEIGNMPVETQEKLLRAVEYGSFERVGSSVPIQVDARIVGATNADLAAMAGDGRFKRDLLDRLSFEVIVLPPLRERREDIPLLAAHFAARMAAELGLSDAPGFAPEAMDALLQHPWPGNIRELKNVVERSVYHCDGPLIESIPFDPFRDFHPAQLPQPSAPDPAPAALPSAPFDQAVRDLEISLLANALAACRHNQRRAAARLGLSYNRFRGLYRKHRDALEAEAGRPPTA